MIIKMENEKEESIVSGEYHFWQLGASFTNILRAAFSYESVLSSFSVLTFRFVIFWRKEIGANAARKMLVKLTHGMLGLLLNTDWKNNNSLTWGFGVDFDDIMKLGYNVYNEAISWVDPTKLSFFRFSDFCC